MSEEILRKEEKARETRAPLGSLWRATPSPTSFSLAASMTSRDSATPKGAPAVKAAAAGGGPMQSASSATSSGAEKQASGQQGSSASSSLGSQGNGSSQQAPSMENMLSMILQRLDSLEQRSAPVPPPAAAAKQPGAQGDSSGASPSGQAPHPDPAEQGRERVARARQAAHREDEDDQRDSDDDAQRRTMYPPVDLHEILRRFSQILPHSYKLGRTSSPAALPYFASDEMPAFFGLLADAKRAWKPTQDERRKWENLVFMRGSLDRVSTHDLKDILEVLNMIDMASESFFNLCSDEDFVTFGPAWVYMTHCYLRIYLCDKVNAAYAKSSALTGNPVKALHELHDRERDPKLRVEKGALDRQRQLIMDTAMVAYYQSLASSSGNGKSHHNKHRSQRKSNNGNGPGSNSAPQRSAVSSSSRGGRASHPTSGSGAAPSTGDN